MAALDTLKLPAEALSITADAPGHYHPGRSGVVRQGPKTVLGCFGELHPRVTRAMGIDGALVAFELWLDVVPLPKVKRRQTPVLSAFQPVGRDFAFIVAPGVEAQAVIRAARGADRTLVTDVSLFDVYEGTPLEAGYRSLGIEVTLQPVKSSLTDEEIEAVSEKIIAAVAKATGATLRR